MGEMGPIMKYGYKRFDTVQLVVDVTSEGLRKLWLKFFIFISEHPQMGFLSYLIHWSNISLCFDWLSLFTTFIQRLRALLTEFSFRLTCPLHLVPFYIDPSFVYPIRTAYSRLLYNSAVSKFSSTLFALLITTHFTRALFCPVLEMQRSFCIS